MKISLSLLTATVFGLTAGGAFAGMPHGWEVNPVNDVVYEVVSEGAHGGAAFWCAAADFAQVHLKASPNAEIYVVTLAGPSMTTKRKSAAQFTLDPVAAGITPGPLPDDLNELAIGGHMKIGVAHGFCAG